MSRKTPAVLVGSATLLALVWANSPWSTGYEHEIVAEARHWINDALMAVFFVVVGLEVKRELTLGALRDRRAAALPVAAALGGMVAPALLFLSCNATGAGTRGWGIPMATDIVFALSVLAVAAPAAPRGVRLFLLTLAVVDDVGAIVVIALVYSGGVHAGWIVGAVGIVVAVAVAQRRVRLPLLAFVAIGVALWIVVRASGVHPTIAGVVVGFLVPPSELESAQRRLQPWSSLVIVPAFALVNAGVALSADALSDALRSRVAIGVVVGLVLGKAIGITAGAGLAVRLGWAALPDDTSWRHVVGVAALGGIGFTVSLFIIDLAFAERALADAAKVGVLAASVVASLLGGFLVRRAATG